MYGKLNYSMCMSNIEIYLSALFYFGAAVLAHPKLLFAFLDEKVTKSITSTRI